MGLIAWREAVLTTFISSIMICSLICQNWTKDDLATCNLGISSNQNDGTPSTKLSLSSLKLPILPSSMAVIPLDMGAFPALIRPLCDPIHRFGNRSVLWDLIGIFVSVVWLPVFAILNEYQAREDCNGWYRPKCSFEYAGPSGLGV